MTVTGNNCRGTTEGREPILSAQAPNRAPSGESAMPASPIVFAALFVQSAACFSIRALTTSVMPLTASPYALATIGVGRTIQELDDSSEECRNPMKHAEAEWLQCTLEAYRQSMPHIGTRAPAPVMSATADQHAASASTHSSDRHSAVGRSILLLLWLLIV